MLHYIALRLNILHQLTLKLCLYTMHPFEIFRFKASISQIFVQII